MYCVRCAGMRVPELILEGGARFFGLRCVHCGDVVDDVIFMNRRRRPPIRLGRSQASSYEDHHTRWGRLVQNIEEG